MFFLKSPYKRISKRNLADVGMNALVDKAHKQGMPHSDMHCHGEFGPGDTIP